MMMKKSFYLILILLTIAGCRRAERVPLPATSNIVGLASPVLLEYDTTVVYLSDYFRDTSAIEGIEIPGMADSLFHLRDGRVTIAPVAATEAVYLLQVEADSITESVPLFRSAKQKVELTFDPAGRKYDAVSVAGEFNGWTAGRTNFELVDGSWKISLLLNPGAYQYQLVADGLWMTDPANPELRDNNAGGFNSVLKVGMDVPGLRPSLFTLNHGRKVISIQCEGKMDGLLVLWQNYLLNNDYLSMKKGQNIMIRIPGAAAEMERSYIRAWAFNEYGVSNDLLIPLEYGRVLQDAASLSRHDHHSLILYNVFVDRFYDADTANNRPLNDPLVLPPADYHGGDLKGVISKLKEGYFDELGVNTIWISPIVRNPEGAYGFWPYPPSRFSGYHGYWPVSFTQVDDRYGTEEDLHELVALAHEKGMNVLLDFVANHVHEKHPVYRENPDWATELYLPDGSLNTERWDEYRLTTWFDVFLPTLDLSKPEVYGMLTDSAVYWIREYGLDGFRHDATKHIPAVFWRTLTRKLKEQVVLPENRPVYQIGETYGGPELIGSYVNSGMLDAQFDFNVYDDALAVLIRPSESFERLDASLHQSMRFYGSHNLMGYISGNQDRGRFTSYAGGSLRFDEDAKLAGWTRTIEVGNPDAYLVTAILFAFNMTIPGLPVIYYGDEIGMAGGNDPDSRRMMRFDELDKEELQLKEKVGKLASLRRNSLALIYGDFESLLVTEDTYAYCRSFFDQIVIVVMNKGSQTKNLTFDIPERFEGISLQSHFGTLPGLRKNRMSVTLGSRSFDIYTAEK
jgi:cyclomaltodextrinase / maltogenic alpha-amylase / neopullulanase